MNVKKIIIIVVFIALILGVFVYFNNKSATTDEEQNGNQNAPANDSNTPGTATNSGNGYNTDTRDPQNKLSYNQSWYEYYAEQLAAMSSGKTSKTEEISIFNIILQCKTRADIMQLGMAYGKDKEGYTFHEMVIYELDDTDGYKVEDLNRKLRMNGVDYQF